MLAPLVEAAGYRLVCADEGAAADIRFAMMGANDEPVDGGGTVIVLHDDPQTRAGRDDAVYRYDKDAIMDALAQAARAAS